MIPILIPSQVELVSSELVFAPVTVLSHVAMSALVGAGPAPAFHEPAADRSVVLFAFVTVAACAEDAKRPAARLAMPRVRRAAEKRGVGNSAPIEPEQMEARRLMRERGSGEVETVEFMGAVRGVILMRFWKTELVTVREHSGWSSTQTG